MTLQAVLNRVLIGLLGLVASAYLATSVADEITETYQPVAEALAAVNERNRP